MTGFGRGEAQDPACTVTVELRSVNHRFLDVAWRLPHGLQGREGPWTQRVKDRVSRGRVDATVRIGIAGGGEGLDRAQLDRYAAELVALADRWPGLGSPAALAPLLALPGVVSRGDQDVEHEGLGALVLQALDGAIDGLVAMRSEEGGRLVGELQGLLDELRLLIEHAASRAALVPGLAKQRLERRLAELIPQGIDAQRLAQEVALMADRADVTEEIVRLRSHVEAFGGAFSSGDAVGRRLDFLAQEFLREANTLGTKGADAELIHTAVSMKTTIETLKEQVANLE